MSENKSKPDTNSKAKRAPRDCRPRRSQRHGTHHPQAGAVHARPLDPVRRLGRRLGAYLIITHFSSANQEAPPKEEANNLKADETRRADGRDRTFNVVDVDPAATESTPTSIHGRPHGRRQRARHGRTRTRRSASRTATRTPRRSTCRAPGGFGGKGQGGAIEGSRHRQQRRGRQGRRLRPAGMPLARHLLRPQRRDPRIGPARTAAAPASPRRPWPAA